MGKLGDGSERCMHERSVVSGNIPRRFLKPVDIDMHAHLNAWRKSFSNEPTWNDWAAVALIRSCAESRDVFASGRRSHRHRDREEHEKGFETTHSKHLAYRALVWEVLDRMPSVLTDRMVTGRKDLSVIVASILQKQCVHEAGSGAHVDRDGSIGR